MKDQENAPDRTEFWRDADAATRLYPQHRNDFLLALCNFRAWIEAREAVSKGGSMTRGELDRGMEECFRALWNECVARGLATGLIEADRSGITAKDEP
jgi:hypothetical protein